MSKLLQPAFLAILLTIPLVTGNASFLQDPDIDPGDKGEEIETLEDIQLLDDIEPAEVETDPGLIEFFGRMHPAVVHFPIAWLVLLLGVEGTALATGGAAWSKAGRFLILVTFISFLPAIATGFVHAFYQGSDPGFLQLMEPHRNLNLSSAALCLGALLLRYRQRETLRGLRSWIYMSLIIVSVLLVLIAGHLGGKMVFGENYLPF